MDKELLEKYCKNGCTEEELISVLNGLKNLSEDLEGKSLLFKIWEELPDDNSDNKINFDFCLKNTS